MYHSVNPRRLRGEPVETQARGGDLRVAEDRRAPAQDAASRPGASELDVHLRLGGVQPGPHPKPGGGAGMSPSAAAPHPNAGSPRTAPGAARRNSSTSASMFPSPHF